MSGDPLLALLVGLHALGAAVWVGGMFFAHMVLRPALLDLDGPERLRVWGRVLRRFFVWVWVAVVTLPASGFGLLFAGHGGFAQSGPSVHLMTATGLLMMAIFAAIWFLPHAAFRRAMAAGDWAAAAGHQASIRRLVLINLVLGLLTVAVGASGRFWG